MSAGIFKTEDGVEIKYYFSDYTIKKCRTWWYRGIRYSEVWAQDPQGVEYRWNQLPLDLQGREGHRYRVCWAYLAGSSTAYLVGSANLDSNRYILSSDYSKKPIANSLKGPQASFANWFLGLSVLASAGVVGHANFVKNSIFANVEHGIWFLLGGIVLFYILGALFDALRHKLDPSYSFDKFIGGALFEKPPVEEPFNRNRRRTRRR